MDAHLDTLATALHVAADDLLNAHPDRSPIRPAIGIAARITHSELITLTVLQALGGFTSEVRWLRHAGMHSHHLFPEQPSSPDTTSAFGL